jgi:hypothetical protein
MQSKHGYILALVAGVGALIVVLGALLILELNSAAQPYLSGREQKSVKPEKTNPKTAPNFTSKVEGSSLNILEVDAAGLPIRLVYVSDLNDPIADFSLFAVPQTNYAGTIYLESVQDLDSTSLIVYPLDVATGNLAAATLNVISNKCTLSPEQNRIAVINTTAGKNITAFDITTGATLASWTLAANERLNETLTTRYTGDGVRWTNNDCFDHAVWVDSIMETRTFCVTELNEE